MIAPTTGPPLPEVRLPSTLHTSPLRVQHIPAGHPYIRSICGPDLCVLSDPPPPGAPPGQWWPHPALEGGWITGHADQVDVVHLHFGYEHRDAGAMTEWVRALAESRIPLILTVHDLVNPHLGPSPEYDALLDVVVPAADAVTTLTTGAAREIARRWSREALVLPHPHVVPAPWLERPRTPHSGWVVSVHAKSLRPSFDVDALLTAADAMRDLPDSVLRLHVHEDVLDPTHPRHDARLANLLSHGHVDAQVHGPLDDEQLWSDLLETDLALLPYRYATHSGWLEMCHDLGTDVLAADVGFLAEQRPIRTYRTRETLPEAIAQAQSDHLADVRPFRPSATVRLTEAHAVRAAHAQLYRDVVEARR